MPLGTVNALQVTRALAACRSTSSIIIGRLQASGLTRIESSAFLRSTPLVMREARCARRESRPALPPMHASHTAARQPCARPTHSSGTAGGAGAYAQGSRAPCRRRRDRGRTAAGAPHPGALAAAVALSVAVCWAAGVVPLPGAAAYQQKPGAASSEGTRHALQRLSASATARMRKADKGFKEGTAPVTLDWVGRPIHHHAELARLGVVPCPQRPRLARRWCAAWSRGRARSRPRRAHARRPTHRPAIPCSPNPNRAPPLSRP